MKRRSFLVSSAAASLGPWAPARSQPKARQRAAVVIGVDKAGELPTLRAAASGARQLEKLLAGEGYEVAALVDDTAPVTVDRIFGAIDGFTRKGTFDQLVVYFAGHGFAAEYAEYWLLSDATHNPNQAVSLRESTQLARLYSGIPNVIFISDACRSTPGSLGLSGIRGGVIFPISGSRSTSDVDQFMATLVGEPALEVALADSTRNYAGIYTSTLLSAFAEASSDMVLNLQGVNVVPNKRLKRYLEREVPLRAQQVNIQLNQRPDAQVTSDDDVYIARAAKVGEGRPGDGAVNVSHLAAMSLGSVGLRGVVQAAPAVDAKGASAARALDAKTGFSSSRATVAGSMKAFEAFVRSRASKLRGASLYVVGSPVKQAFAIVDGSARPFERIDDNAFTLEVPRDRAASALIQFADGSSTMVAALYDYAANVVVAQNGVINVSFLPRYGMYDSEHLEQLHSAVATAARFGVFRIEREEGKGRNAGGQLADMVRMMKSVDPTLGLYAAYAYSDAGIEDQVQSVRKYMRGFLQVDLFDTAMLAGALARKEVSPSRTAPLCPMLAQGWALLRVSKVQLPKDLAVCRDHLRPSLWTTFDAKGTDLLLDAMQAGRLKA